MPGSRARPPSRTTATTVATLPAALPRGLLIMLGLAAVTVTIGGIRAVSDIAAPAFLALVLSIAVHPVRGWLVRHRAPGWLATVTTILTAWGILVVLAGSLVLAGAHFAALLTQYQDDATALLHDAESWLGNLGVDGTQASSMTSSLDLARLGDLVGSILASLFGAISNLLFIGTLLLFIVADASWFPLRLDGVRDIRTAVVEALESFAHGTRSYLVVSTVFGLIVASIDTLLLWALDVPEPLVWGLLAFITNYVPNIGFVIGLVPPAILALLDGGVTLFLVVIVSYSLINVVIQTIIQPKVVGDAVGLSTSITFMSLVFWAWVLGPLGALLAIPLSLLLKALLIDVDHDTVWVRPLISGLTSDAATAPADATPTPAAGPT
ncbi:AI-2E family transporter [Nocardioides sp. Soil805]|uniref:AI-2E family transporter n=1 Tax=Nocardioides sp. Soil805 TaxID=1736416 RepID=UPI00070316A8|nr:AI-2E family transporter [Nocardioides sp. Soil805]KRF30363.1 permease [Nocardioides sp. Soil805]